MTKPVRLQLSRRKGFDLQAFSRATNSLPAVNVARPGKLGNPFIVGTDGTRAECVRFHELLLGGQICLTARASVAELQAYRKTVAASLDDLLGKNLACWCRGSPCHGDTLLRVANAKRTRR